MKRENLIRVAIDGPAAAGKSTVAKRIAEMLSFVYVDTGAMYRAITLKAIRENIDLENEQAVMQLLNGTEIKLMHENNKQVVYIDEEDVTEVIRNHEVSNAVSHVAKHKAIRDEMVARQREMADNVNVIMDGRDIGTNVLPHAEVKIFLIASVEERAKRRYEENMMSGLETNLEQLKREIAERDERDSKRLTAPLKQADDAIAIDTTALSINEVVEEIIKYIEAYKESTLSE